MDDKNVKKLKIPGFVSKLGIVFVLIALVILWSCLSSAFFTVNKKLADKYGMKCWTNAETFDRDMPIKFLPIKFDKLRMKLEAAKRAGYDKAITFEFSHFMSPQSAYLQAGNLYNRYIEYFEIK